MSDENSVDARLEMLQQESFNYCLHETNPANPLVVDKNEANWPASTAATGLALAAYPVAVERGFMSRPAAGRRTLNTLRFFWNSRQGPEPDGTGYRGFYLWRLMRNCPYIARGSRDLPGVGYEHGNRQLRQRCIGNRAICGGFARQIRFPGTWNRFRIR